MPPRPAPSRIAQALEYLQGLKSGVGEFVGGVGSNLADRARAAGGLAYEALTTDPNIGRMTTAEFSQAAADRAPTPRLDQAARDIGTIGRAIATQPYETGKAIVGGEIDRFKGAFASPQAAGQYAGSLIDPTRLAAALRHRVPISELDVYHATPHKFEPTESNPLGEFDASKIGTGEGAQAYGHGIYTAESPGTAQSYYDQFKQQIQGSFDTVIDRRLDAFMKEFGGDVQKAADRFMAGVYDTPKNKAAMRKEVLERLEARTRQPYMLKADLPDEMIDRMLDWDAPLGEQPSAIVEAIQRAGLDDIGSAMQSVKPDIAKLAKNAQSLGVPAEELQKFTSAIDRAIEYQSPADAQDAFANFARVVGKYDDDLVLDDDIVNLRGIINDMSGGDFFSGLTGAQVYANLRSRFRTQEEASRYLQQIGVPGIKYFDAASRGVRPADGTRNFVVFPGEEKKVKILRRE